MFGLGQISCDYTVDVRWPDGTKQHFTAAQIPLNHYLTIAYPNTVTVE
jgi:hypothetical protein